MPMGLDRYNLANNPYTPSPLDPLARRDDEDLLVPTVDFDALDRHFKQTAELKEPLFFLVVGERGAGRNSIANYIFARYCDHRNISRKRLVAASLDDPKHSKFLNFKRWLINLSSEIKHGSLSAEFPNKYADSVMSEVNHADEDTMEESFRDILRGVSNTLDLIQPPAGMGLFWDGVPTFGMIDSAFNIFKGMRMIGVFSTLDAGEPINEVIDPFRYSNLGRLVKLTKVEGEQINYLATTRWQGAHRNPFDPDGLKKAFGNRERAVGRVLYVLSVLLDLKVELNPSGEEWPTAGELFFSEAELEISVPLAERSWR